jgi:hypothetical protein
MALNLYEASGDQAGIFNILAKAFKAIETLNTARLTTVPDKVKAFIDRYKLKDTDLATDQMLDGVSSSVELWAGSGSTLTGQLVASLETFLNNEVVADDPAATNTLLDSLTRIIDQMEDQGLYVESSSVSASLATGGSNTGDPAIVFTLLTGTGKTEAHLIAEDIAVTTAITGTTTSIVFSGEESESDLIRETWPLGSGATIGITPGQGNIVSNGDFETATTTNIPDDWTITTGTVGTNIALTPYEVQTIVIAGTPTGGAYWLSWNDGTNTQATYELTYDASSSDVQTALRTIPGLEGVTVESSGTSPDLTHTVTFFEANGNPAQLTSISALTGGTPTITHATTTSGVSGSYTGRALALQGTASAALMQSLELIADTSYLLHARMRADATMAAGTVSFQLIDGIGGNVLTDSASANNSIPVTCASLSGSVHTSHSGRFAIKPTQTGPVYLRISAASIPAGRTVYIDDVQMIAAESIYNGGPSVAVFPGRLVSSSTDTWTLTVTNDRAGSIQEWFNRVFAMADLGLLLPTSGSTQIPDSIIA